MFLLQFWGMGSGMKCATTFRLLLKWMLTHHVLEWMFTLLFRHWHLCLKAPATNSCNVEGSQCQMESSKGLGSGEIHSFEYVNKKWTFTGESWSYKLFLSTSFPSFSQRGEFTYRYFSLTTWTCLDTLGLQNKRGVSPKKIRRTAYGWGMGIRDGYGKSIANAGAKCP